MRCDSWTCPICRWGRCTGDLDAAREFGWCTKTEEELEEMLERDRDEQD